MSAAPKTQKTSFALTAPTPIDFFAVDQGFEQLIGDLDRLTSGKNPTISLDPSWQERKKQIYPHVYPRTVNPEVDPAGADAEMDQLLRLMAEDFQTAVQDGTNGSGGTIVLDGGTMLQNHLTARAQRLGEEMKRRGSTAPPSPRATTTGRRCSTWARRAGATSS